MNIRIIPSVEDWTIEAKELIKNCSAYKDRATLVALSGDLGAGKTTFVQQIAKELGVDEPITSPTFTIMKRYETEHEKFKALIHMDVYRLESEKELEPLRFSEIVNTPETLICIEWAEKIRNALPKRYKKFHLEIDNQNKHTIQSLS